MLYKILGGLLISPFIAVVLTCIVWDDSKTYSATDALVSMWILVILIELFCLGYDLLTK